MKFFSDRCVVWWGNCNACVSFCRLYFCDALDGGGRREYRTWLDSWTACRRHHHIVPQKMIGQTCNIPCGGHGQSPSWYTGDQTCWQNRATHWRRTSAALWQLICIHAEEQCHTGHVTRALAAHILSVRWLSLAAGCAEKQRSRLQC